MKSTKKVVGINSRRKRKAVVAESTSRPCSFTAVSDKGNRVHGMAAFMVLSKRHGGVDNMIATIAERSVTIAMDEFLNNNKTG